MTCCLLKKVIKCKKKLNTCQVKIYFFLLYFPKFNKKIILNLKTLLAISNTPPPPLTPPLVTIPFPKKNPSFPTLYKPPTPTNKTIVISNG